MFGFGAKFNAKADLKFILHLLLLCPSQTFFENGILLESTWNSLRLFDWCCLLSSSVDLDYSKQNPKGESECDLRGIVGPPLSVSQILAIIIHQTHHQKSDWSRACNQFTIACELDMINAISAGDIAFIMSSSTSAWVLSPLECSPQKENGWTLRFCGWIIYVNV